MENPVLPSSCVIPAGTSIEVQNEWEENTHTQITITMTIISVSITMTIISVSITMTINSVSITMTIISVSITITIDSVSIRRLHY